MDRFRILRALIGVCDSERDLNALLRILSDESEVEELRRFLNAALTNLNGSGSRSSLRQSSLLSQQSLASRFRQAKMTNKEIETWLKANFNVRGSVGKRGLSEYLPRVTNRLNLNEQARLETLTKTLAERGLDRSPDLEEFWKRTDESLHPRGH